MTVLHIAAPGRVGGLETVVALLARCQLDAGHAVHVAAVAEGELAGHPMLDALRAASVPVHPIRVAPRNYVGEHQRVAALCRALRPTVVHTHGYRSDLVAAPAARRAGAAVITTVHGFTGGDLRNRAYQWLQRRAFRRFDAVVAVSRPLHSELLHSHVPPGRLHLIANAFTWNSDPLPRPEARAVLGLPPHAFVVGWVGRLSREKGADVLLDAMHRTIGGPTVVSIVGDGPERGALQRRASPSDVDVRWHGAVPDAGRLFRAFDLFVLSSRTEGTPMVLLEAMAAEVPVIATAVGGIPDVVAPSHAFVIEPERPDLLAEAIRAVRADPASAADRARRSRLRLEQQFATSPWARRYDAVYLAALTHRSRLTE